MPPYERLLGDAMRGDPTSSPARTRSRRRGRSSIRSSTTPTPVHPTSPGTWGPAEADALIEWRRLLADAPTGSRHERAARARRVDGPGAHHAEIGDRHLRDLFAERPRPGRAAGRRGGGPLPRLLEEPRHRRDDAAAGRPGRGVRPAPSARGDVPRRADQRLRGPGRAPRRAADADGTRSLDGGRRATWSPRCTRCSTGWRRSPTGSAAATWTGPHRQADPQRRQHRHRRLGPRPGDGLRGAAPLQRPRAAPSGSSPTSTAPTSPRRPATSTPPRRCSSSPRRRSPRWRR